METLRETRKRYIKQLPVWDLIGKFDAKQQQLKWDIDKHVENVNRLSLGVDSVPKFPENGLPPKTAQSSRRVTFHEVIKTFEKDSDTGEIIVKTITPEQASTNRMPTDVTTSSIELLQKRPTVGEAVFARLKEGEPWIECFIRESLHKSIDNRPVAIFKLTSRDGQRLPSVKKFEIARKQSHGDNLRVPKRVIAGPSDQELKAGILGAEPNKGNKFRYLVLMDDGSAYYFKPEQVYPILYQSRIPWKDLRLLGVNNRFLDAELSLFFKLYPQRKILKIKPGDRLEVARNGVVVPAIILATDCDTIRLAYKDQTEESIWRGSPRFMKRSNIASQLLANELIIDRLFPKMLGNIRRYHEAGQIALNEEYLTVIENFDINLTICGQGKARKSTGRISLPKLKISIDNEEVPEDMDSQPDLADLMRDKNASHKCTPDCKRRDDMKTEEDVNDIVAEYRDVSDLKVPLMLGWRRILVKADRQKGKMILYVYIAPCGRVFNQLYSIRRYIQTTNSKFDIDYFTLDREVMLNRTLGEQPAFHYDDNMAVDGNKKPLENKKISLINPISEERLPLDFEYRNETFPHPMLAQKGFSFNTEFKSYCECTDDCNQRASCPCHVLNEEAADSGAHKRGNIDYKCQYKEKRLMAQVPTGIFECNSSCNCSSKCPNRVVQNGIRIRLQVRKTLEKGWGVFALDDVPKGAFVCTYSAELLDDADQYGNSDMYYADLDYISVVEEQKLALMREGEISDEGVCSDDEDYDVVSAYNAKSKSKSKKRQIIEESDDESDDRSSQEVVDNLNGQIEDFLPKKHPTNMRYPRRSKPATQREANRMGNFKKIHTLLNETHDYTLDARIQGNIGRFFNHSCDPNTYVQNVFIETHDLRFPVVAFFAKCHIKADDEITWNYNYKIGSIEGREILCNCGASNCVGRIL